MYDERLCAPRIQPTVPARSAAHVVLAPLAPSVALGSLVRREWANLHSPALRPHPVGLSSSFLVLASSSARPSASMPPFAQKPKQAL